MYSNDYFTCMVDYFSCLLYTSDIYGYSKKTI